MGHPEKGSFDSAPCGRFAQDDTGGVGAGTPLPPYFENPCFQGVVSIFRAKS